MLICKEYDNAIRWKEGERLDHLFEDMCDALERDGKPDHPAVISGDKVVTFRELDSRANQAARYLIGQGVKSGDRVGLLFDKSVDTYVALLAVLKVNAAYVPFDGSFPNDRIRFIMEDSGVERIVSQSQFEEKLSDLGVPAILLDSARAEIEGQEKERLSEEEKGRVVDEVAYLIYTSGTTGKPKGVVVEHGSICNFVRVAAEIYGYGPDDRVYQGMTIAFDFSVEELWVPLLAGSALVPAKPGASLVGNDLADYLLENKVTGLACVPTLLATIEKDLPDLRLLIVSGEACPQNLVTRWHRPGRTILNAYGPTEATVTCTLTELMPDQPVTIGGPLPTYTIVILDPDKGEIVGDGELGEIGIAGIGLAQGYLNRPELTAEKFIPDFLDIANNPSKRIYRSGDLGRINDNDEVEFHGRIDTQVKLRGYRIELAEIESILMEFPQIAQAVVDTYEEEPGAVELVAYYTLNEGEGELSHNEIVAVFKERLPRYMVPAYYEELSIIPMTPSHKADRKNLPAPKGARFSGGSGNIVAPTNEKEEFLAKTLADVLQVEEVSIEDNFFLDLGAHSLLMARYCTAVRKNPDLASASMRDIYLYPTIAQLAANLGPALSISSVQTIKRPLHIPSNFAYYGCGALQLAFYVASGLFGIWVLLTGFHWTYAVVDDSGGLYGRLFAFFVASFTGMSVIPIAAKWLLVGKWRVETFPVWSLRYFRFWVVKSLLQSSPLALFMGGPIYNLYLRALGAKVGANVVITSPAPVCTDLFSIGENSVIRRDTILQGYKAQGNVIHIGPIHIGSDAYVGAASVVDINTMMEDDTQLGHSSSLHSGQEIPQGKHFHGTPAEETQADYCTLETINCSSLRRWLYSIVMLVLGMGVAPLPIMMLYYAFPYVYDYTNAAGFAVDAPLTTIVAFAPDFALGTFVFILGFGLFGLIIICAVPRFFNLFLKPGKTYVLYGFHYFMQGMVSASSSSGFYNLLFGDSSYIVYFLKSAGYELNKVVQTGANFGLDQVHDNPLLCDIGSGSMVSDGFTMMNMEMSSNGFRLGRVEIGDKNYLGNNIHYPEAGRTGANCLLATKVMIPIDGPLRENVGLLGSPCFEIPRVVEQDKQLADQMDEKTLRQSIARKNRRNIVTMVGYLFCIWLYSFIVLMSAYLSVLFYPAYGFWSMAALGVFGVIFTVAYFVVIERASLKFGSLQPNIVTMYDDYFLFHERHWKFCGNPLPGLFKGTPFRNLISRLLGVKLGRKVFDDGGKLFDKTLIEVGDYVNLNEASTIQGHSLEEGMFKCDRVKIGNGCTLAARAFVHYGVTMGDNVALGPNAFLMKGESPPVNSVWQGNPASEV